MSKSVGRVPSSGQIKKLRLNLLAWFDDNREVRPWREDFKRLASPYPVWISEIMLQQTTIPVVLPIYTNFINRYPTVRHLAQAPLAEVLNALTGLGYYQRFRNLHKAAQNFVTEANSAGGTLGLINWPKNYVDWLKIPGVGPYTAGAISSIVLGEAKAAVDGNVERILCRLLEIKNPVSAPGIKVFIREIAEKLVCPNQPGNFNEALMELGQKICKKSRPNCPLCPLRNQCQASKQGTQNLLPSKSTLKKKVEIINFIAQVHIWGDKMGLIKRGSSDTRFLKQSTGFPLVEIKAPGEHSTKILESGLSHQPNNNASLQLRHRITKHDLRIWIKIYKYQNMSHSNPRILWWNQLEIPKIINSSLDKKIFDKVHSVLTSS